ncbi:MAG: sulfate transporter subunit, partial [Myxococcales bacterium]
DAYLRYLYSDEGQEIVARHYYRPRSKKVMARHADKFAKVKLFTIDEAFGGWEQAQRKHFDSGGVFDQIVESQR